MMRLLKVKSPKSVLKTFETNPISEKIIISNANQTDPGLMALIIPD